jgi:hypothetical protein
MIREEITFLGCGYNKAKYAGKMKYCIEHGLDFEIYNKFGIELEIEGKDLHSITKEAQEIVYN